MAWIGLIADEHPELHALLDAVPDKSDKAYLVYMSVRLIEMRRILKDTGSIYLHCDPKMSAWLRITLDAIFGKKNFRREIIWNIAVLFGFKTKTKNYVRGHDNLMFF